MNEKEFYDIYWSIYFLGFKRENPFNNYFIENLKDICEFEKIKDSPFTKHNKEFNYNNIDENFLQNFNDFIEAISDKKINEKKIIEIIQKLKKIL